MTNDTPTITVILCTQNRSTLLRGALASLSSLATDGRFTYEILVVDNASSDDTPEVVRQASAASGGLVRGVLEPHKGIVPARNRGIQEARGRWIAFFDDDQLADQRWLAELYQGAHNHHCRVVGGSVYLKFSGGCARQLHPAVRMLLGEAEHGDRPVPYGGRLTPGCGNLMVERSVFEEVGVFERAVDGRGEDTDLFSRIERAGIGAWYLPAAIVHHLTPPARLEREYLFSLARRMGAGIALRQQAAMSRRRFGALLIAKAARLALWQAPLTLVATVLSDREAWLGRRCLMAINSSFVRRGLGLCLAGGPPQPRTSQPAAGTLRPAPVLAGGQSLSPNSSPEVCRS